MSCCSPTDYKEEEIDGKCEHCGEPTVGGYAYECCSYSGEKCEHCGFTPCNLSC